jgi:hypothetical protein
VSVVQSTSSGVLKTTHALDNHYKVRILVSLWWLSGTSSITISLNVTSLPASTTIAAPSAATNATSSYQAYCTGSRATNVDWSTSNFVDLGIEVAFTSGSASWGIR